MKERIEHKKLEMSFLDSFQQTQMKLARDKGLDPARMKMPDPLQVQFLPTITIKFREGTAARLDGKTGKLFQNAVTAEDERFLERAKLTTKIAQEGLDVTNEVLTQLRIASVHRLLGRPLAVLEQERQEAQKHANEELADPSLFFVADGTGRSFEVLAHGVDQLNAHPAVEIAYLEPRPYPAAIDFAPSTMALTGQSPGLAGRERQTDD
jgi:hypothetical protein